MKILESPKRKQQKENDYRRHALLRKIKRRRKSRMEQLKKGNIPTYEDGKDSTSTVSNGSTVDQMRREEQILSQLPRDYAEGSYRNAVNRKYMSDEQKQALYTQRQMYEANKNRSKAGQKFSDALDTVADVSMMLPPPINWYGHSYYGLKGAQNFIQGDYGEGAIDTSIALSPFSGNAFKTARSVLGRLW